MSAEAFTELLIISHHKVTNVKCLADTRRLSDAGCLCLLRQ
jgi:hypothetical protein